MEAKEKVLTAMQLSQQPMKPGEIAEAAGLDKKDVEKAIKALKDSEQIYSPKKCYYQVK
jgi:DNA-binding transcriptional regulator GbsR (MarR family)